jgi:hypothetical protein
VGLSALSKGLLAGPTDTGICATTRLRIRLAVWDFPPSAVTHSSFEREPTGFQELPQRGSSTHVSGGHPNLTTPLRPSRQLKGYYGLSMSAGHSFDDEESTHVVELTTAKQRIESPQCQNVHHADCIVERSPFEYMCDGLMIYHRHASRGVNLELPANIGRQFAE